MYAGRKIDYAARTRCVPGDALGKRTDWMETRPGAEQIAHNVLSRAHPGAIVLMHDGPALRDQTAAALPLILRGLAQRGLTPVTLPKLLADGQYPGVRVTSPPAG